MMNSRYRVRLFMAGVVGGLAASAARAGYVMPMMGGGQVMGTMIHADVGFDGTNVSVAFHVEPDALPILRPLTPPDEFDPTQPWAVLQGKAYNFQYAWNPAGFITLPAGAGIWIERLQQDAALEAYLRPPAAPAWSPVFTHDGERWQWSGAMTHNAYAVLHPTADHYQATYRVYIGDATTGDLLAGYGSAEVTWKWRAVPEPASAVLLGAAVAGVLARRRRARVTSVQE